MVYLTMSVCQLSVIDKNFFYRGSGYGQKLYAHGRRHVHRMARWQEFSASRFDAERHDRIAVLVGSEQESAVRINPETARSFSPGRFMAYISESSGTLMDPVDHDAVVTPVRNECYSTRK